jgi:hypothetical protein
MVPRSARVSTSVLGLRMPYFWPDRNSCIKRLSRTRSRLRGPAWRKILSLGATRTWLTTSRLPFGQIKVSSMGYDYGCHNPMGEKLVVLVRDIKN